MPGTLRRYCCQAATKGTVLYLAHGGKAIASLTDVIRGNAFQRDETIVFVHTGRQAGLLGYREYPSKVAC
jgi:1-aminocyclopropane-1-carboxylate deaminase/D-cysteine desulfhydrase-like pyridoxal-dependent ACC family enzyme